MTQILDPYEIYSELDKSTDDEVEWDLGPACSIDPDDTCESCQ